MTNFRMVAMQAAYPEEFAAMRELNRDYWRAIYSNNMKPNKKSDAEDMEQIKIAKRLNIPDAEFRALRNTWDKIDSDFENALWERPLQRGHSSSEPQDRKVKDPN